MCLFVYLNASCPLGYDGLGFMWSTGLQQKCAAIAQKNIKVVLVGRIAFFFLHFFRDFCGFDGLSHDKRDACTDWSHSFGICFLGNLSWHCLAISKGFCCMIFIS